MPECLSPEPFPPDQGSCLSWYLNRVLLHACLYPAGNTKHLDLIFLSESVLGGAAGGAAFKKMRSGDARVPCRSVFLVEVSLVWEEERGICC